MSGHLLITCASSGTRFPAFSTTAGDASLLLWWWHAVDVKPLKSNNLVVIVNAKYKTTATVSATANGLFLDEPVPRACICD